MSPSITKNYAYATLLTRSSYLAGVVILAHTLKKHQSKYPLIVLYTDSLHETSVRALEIEAPKSNLVLKSVRNLLPLGNPVYIAERFIDTWTKLRVFELTSYDKVCYLDADMAVRRDMDTIFDVTLPDWTWIAANHVCVCNLDKDAWAPEDWTSENCAYTPISHPQALTNPTSVTSESRPTYHLLNSGMFLFEPTKELWTSMMDFFQTSLKIVKYKFPDQDFLTDFFRHKFLSVGWQYNAIKTMRYWHPNIWRDDEVVCLHYIVDKPWASRIAEDGRAGYLGKDGVTHSWWWQDFEVWRRERSSQGLHEVIEHVEEYVAKADDPDNDRSSDLKAIGSQVQAFANNK